MVNQDTFVLNPTAENIELFKVWKCGGYVIAICGGGYVIAVCDE